MGPFRGMRVPLRMDGKGSYKRGLLAFQLSSCEHTAFLPFRGFNKKGYNGRTALTRKMNLLAA
jgi:hypothetical protein